jgi:hypothetical protein
MKIMPKEVLDAANKAIEGIELSTDKEFAKEFFIKGYNSAPQVDGEPVAYRCLNLKNNEYFYLDKKNTLLNCEPLYTYQPDASAKIAELEKQLADLEAQLKQQVLECQRLNKLLEE